MVKGGPLLGWVDCTNQHPTTAQKAKSNLNSICNLATQELHADCANQKHDGRHHHGDSPGHVCFQARFNHWVEKYRHHKNLGHATTQIAPACRRGVGCAYHIWREHERAPKLVGHEGGTCAANEEPDEGVIPGRGDGCCHENLALAQRVPKQKNQTVIFPARLQNCCSVGALLAP